MTRVHCKQTNETNRIANEGLIFVLIGISLTVLTYIYMDLWALFPLIITLFIIFFFRNPQRSIPDCEGIVVSPADGRVIRIEPVFEDKYIKQDMLRITIFMSLFNVHINRMPISGTVEKVVKRSGDYIPAYKPEAPERNVACYTVVNTRWGKVLIAQITGAIARRLVCYAHPGEEFSTGQIFGLIRFGSCVQLYLPREAQITVKVKDRVRGGETEIGRLGR